MRIAGGRFPWMVPVAAAVGLLLAACGGATPTAGASNGTGSNCALTIKITQTTPTVWGTVTVSSGAGASDSVTSANKVLKFPCGSALTLRESPAQATTWPFKDWVVNGDQGKYANADQNGSSFALTLNGSTTVIATYALISASTSIATTTTAPTTNTATRTAPTGGTTAAAGGW